MDISDLEILVKDLQKRVEVLENADKTTNPNRNSTEDS